MSRKTRAGAKLWEKLRPLAREMRHDPTPAENKLWEQLRRHQLDGIQFRRQHGIGRFIVDFCCCHAKLVIEVDGSIHQYTAEEDAIRQEFIESLGFRVLRFTNDEVMNDLAGVLTRIREAINISS
jgi:very-short-patch-repair endonuclease